ncbi:zinc finger protein unc-98 [Ditylenchus destructor]|uniref:Zinc finger protein unc-98 n=1 Tax=Ditylenchus destructor TaxID=166010 RepID=A0AAD4QWJ3_9BILA|nr:zinc finger protein unc-98 [Ditylenchus destructor]
MESSDENNQLNPELVTSAQSTTPTTADDEHLSDSLKTVVIAGEETDDIPKEDIPKDDIPKDDIPEPESTEKPTGTVQASTVKDENGFVYYKCRFCGLTYNFMTTLKAHERIHDIEAPYLCNKCGESFHYMCELEYHSKTHLKQKGYKCDCGRTFFQYTDLLYHHHPGEDPEPDSVPLPVRPADSIPPSSSRPAIDPAAFPIPEFMEKGYEPKHPMRVYSDVRSRPYICQYCSKSYSDSRQLAYHMSGHRGERTFNPRASRYLMCRNENSYMSPGADV